MAAPIAPPGSEALEADVGELGRLAELKIPPGNAILGADDAGVFAEKRQNLRNELAEAVRLYAEEDDVNRASIGEIFDDARVRLVLTVLGAEDPDAALLHHVRRCGPRAKSVTSSPARDIFAPM